MNKLLLSSKAFHVLSNGYTYRLFYVLNLRQWCQKCFQSNMANLQERYEASMVLSAVGDAMGYYNGAWEFTHSGETIHKECQKLGGVANLKVKLPKWVVSDDTVMNLATAEALIQTGYDISDKEKLYSTIAQAYKDCWKDMGSRAPGATCAFGVHALRPLVSKGWQIPFNMRGGGCGAAMRSMCIGLRFPRQEQESELISVSIESGRMTHHHPTGYLGSLAGALFTAYAIQGKPAKEWGCGLMKTLQNAKEYVEAEGAFVTENIANWDYFTNSWEKYLALRGITDGSSGPTFPENYTVDERDKFYKSVSFSGWGGSSGHDAPMIAYDALLGSGDNWVELCHRAVLHGGDSDSTGVMAAAWYGAIHGFKDVPEKNHYKVEYRDRLIKCGQKLYALAYPDHKQQS